MASTRPVSAGPRRSFIADSMHFGLDDTEEYAWMYASLPKAPTTKAELAAAAVGKFKSHTKYRRYFVRVAVRAGSANATLHTSDDPDDTPHFEFDLLQVSNVTKVDITAAESLPFVVEEGGDERIQAIHGQIALGLVVDDGRIVKLAMSTTEDRDAWFHWFSELVVQRELAAIEAQGAAERRAAFDSDANTRVRIDRPDSTAEGKVLVREYTRKFLLNTVRAVRADEVPNKGKLHVKPPHFIEYVACTVQGAIKTGELSFSQSTASGFFAKKLPPSFSLDENCRVVASMPWSTEFAVFTNEVEAWQFNTKSVEIRNMFVNYFRLVKGRGRLSQSDKETFPYLTNADLAADADEKATASAALAMKGSFASLNRRLTLGDRDDDDDYDMMATDDDEDESREPTPAPEPIKPKEPEQLTFERALEDFPELLWTTLDDLDSPRSTDSDRPRSARPFKPFPGHFDNLLLPFVDETCQPHVIGRRNFRLSVHPKSAQAKLIADRAETSQKLGGRQQSPRASPKRRVASPSPTRRSPAAARDGSPGARPGSPRPIAAGTRTRFVSRSSAMSPPTKVGNDPRDRAMRKRTPNRLTRHVPPDAAALDPDGVTSPIDVSRSLKIGLQRMAMKPEDKERLRPRPAQEPVIGQDTRQRRARTSLHASRGAQGLRESDAVRVPRALFSSAAPHIALSAHLGAASSRR